MDESYNKTSSSIACGGVFWDHNGKWLRGFSSFEDNGDVYTWLNYWALLGLRLAWQPYGFRRVVCEFDCLEVTGLELIDEQICDTLVLLFLIIEVRCLIMNEWECVVQTCESNNKVADLLAKLDLREKWSLTTWILLQMMFFIWKRFV